MFVRFVNHIHTHNRILICMWSAYDQAGAMKSYLAVPRLFQPGVSNGAGQGTFCWITPFWIGRLLVAGVWDVVMQDFFLERSLQNGTYNPWSIKSQKFGQKRFLRQSSSHDLCRLHACQALRSFDLEVQATCNLLVASAV